MVKRQSRLIIEWTATAEKQFFDILEYWTERNQSTNYAEKLIASVNKRTKVISKSPHSSPLTNFQNTRKSALGHFSILYKIFDSKLIITAFWDNRQDPRKLYELLKKR